MNMKLWNLLKDYQKKQLFALLKKQYKQNKLNTSFYANNVTFCNNSKQGELKQ